MATFARNPHDGVELAYDVVENTGGAGQSVLLVHGSALSKAIWRGFGYTKALRENYRVITMDLRGHGRSDKPSSPEAYTMATMVDDVLAVLDAAADGPVHYGGYSVGARIGFSLVTSAPERVRSFASFGGTYRIQAGNHAALFFPRFEEALAAGGMPAFIAGWEARIGKPLDLATRGAFLANDAPAILAYFQQTQRDAPVPEAELAAVTLPTLLVVGSNDPERLVDSRRAAELMEGSHLVELPGRNHGTTLVPAAPVLDVFLPFLDGAG